MRGRTLDRREKQKRTLTQKQIDALEAVFYCELNYVPRYANNVYYQHVLLDGVDVTSRLDKLRRIGMVRFMGYSAVPKTYMLTPRGKEEVRKLGL